MEGSTPPEGKPTGGFDLAGLKPAEAGFIIDSESSLNHVYATFTDLLVRGRINATGSGDARAFWWNGARNDLNEFESLVVEACFSNGRTVPERNVRDALDGIDLDAFRSGVFMRAIRKGCYEPPSDMILGLIFQRDLFNRKVRPVALALMALSLGLPLFTFTILLSFLLFFVPIIGLGMFFLTFALFPLAVIGGFSGFAMVVWLNINAKKLRKDFVIPPEFIIAGFLLFFLLGHAGIGLMLYIYMRRSTTQLADLDRIMTAKGRAQRDRYLELRSYLSDYPLAQSRLANEFEPYAIAFAAIPRGIPS